MVYSLFLLFVPRVPL